MRKVTEIQPMGSGAPGMISQEQWSKDAYEALTKVYQPDEAKVVVEWFERIRGSEECALVGEGRVNSHIEFAYGLKTDPFPSVYASLMSRMWIYAPYIIQEAINDGELKSEYIVDYQNAWDEFKSVGFGDQQSAEKYAKLLAEKEHYEPVEPFSDGTIARYEMEAGWRVPGRKLGFINVYHKDSYK